MSPASAGIRLRGGALPLALTLTLSRGVGARAASGVGCGEGPSYTQGQSPEPRTREYFYYIDHQGQLFLDNAKVKNFITCFKDRQFLVFFFSRLRKNQSGRYEDTFPFVSLCGRERNFIRCDDLPVVFTHLLADGPGPPRLSYGGAGEALAIPFEPARLMPLPANGRLYHPAPKLAGGVGLVRSSLAFELSSCFQYPPGGATLPTHILWQGQKYPLTMDLAPLFSKSNGP
ncbi:UPF0598 protein C8orf82 homolog [Gracilinanus agilis]|uniref:UPF0598 protein C8orf82 homolog n=1 Tax=Gracilinanus agilis TaxID=191870 RepID=UPI001CFD2DCA|nr:UPF0598 protein C8orf82 homolog [Gracilinanus agilis]